MLVWVIMIPQELLSLPSIHVILSHLMVHTNCRLVETTSNATFSRANYVWLNNDWGTEADYLVA